MNSANAAAPIRIVARRNWTRRDRQRTRGFTGDCRGAGLWKCVQNTPSGSGARRFRRGLVAATTNRRVRPERLARPGVGNTPIKLNQVAIETLFENDAAPVLSTNMVLHGSPLIGLVESYWFSNASFREYPGNAENEIASTVVSLVFCPRRVQ